MAYEKVFDNPYPDGWEDLPNETTPITASALQEHTDAIENIEDYLEDNPIQEWAQSETKPEYYSTEIKIQSVANPNYTQQDFNDGISAELQSIPFEYVSNETFGELSDDVDSLKESLTHQADEGFLQRNLWNPNAKMEKFDLNGSGAYRYGHSFSGNATYTLQTKSSVQMYYRTPKADLSDRGSTVSIPTNSSVTVTVPSDCVLWVFSTTDLSYESDKTQVELGSVAHSYTPFAYGNTDLTKDVNDIDASMKMLGWTTPDSLKGKNYISNGAFYQKIYRLNISDVTIEEAGSNIFYLISSPESVLGNDSSYTPIYCSKIPTIKGGDFGSATLGIAIGHNNRKIYIKDASVSTASAFKTKYANTYIYYELETVIAKYVDGNEIAPNLKESLSQLMPTSYGTSGLTYTNCSYLSGGYVKIGNLVVVNLRISSDGSSTFQINNLPSYTNKSSLNCVAVSIFDTVDHNNQVFGYMASGGVLRAESVSGAHAHLISTVYLCD